MRKKFASLVLLSVFTAGVTASSAVSASNSSVGGALAQVSDKVGSGEGVVNSGDSKENNGSAENLDNNEEKSDEVKNLKDEENPTEKDNNLEEQSGEKKDLVYTSKEKEPDNKNVLKIAGGVLGTGSGVAVFAYVAKEIQDSKNKEKSKIDDNSTNTGTDTFPSQPDGVKKDKPGSDEEKSEENSDGGFAAWYKNNMGLSIPLTAYIIWIIVRMIWLEIMEKVVSDEQDWGGLTAIDGNLGIHPFIICGDINKKGFERNYGNDKESVVGFKRVLINLLIAATFSRVEDYMPYNKENIFLQQEEILD